MDKEIEQAGGATKECHEDGSPEETGKSKHWLIMLLCCLVPIIAIVVVAGLGYRGALTYGLLLLCPLGHLLMMGMMGKGHKH